MINVVSIDNNVAYSCKNNKKDEGKVDESNKRKYFTLIYNYITARQMYVRLKHKNVKLEVKKAEKIIKLCRWESPFNLILDTGYFQNQSFKVILR